MTFKVIIMPVSMEELSEYADYIARDSAPRARAWFDSMVELMQALEEMPYRYPAVEDSEKFGRDLRVINTKSHYIFFSIHEAEKRIEILRVWHTARRPLSATDFPKKL